MEISCFPIFRKKMAFGELIFASHLYVEIGGVIPPLTYINYFERQTKLYEERRKKDHPCH